MSETPDKLVKEAHKGQVVYHISREATAIEAREKPEKKSGKVERANSILLSEPQGFGKGSLYWILYTPALVLLEKH
jgi:hypothetical protein